MKCKNCGFVITNEELIARFQAGIGHCPNCNPIDWELSDKYNRLILKSAKFEDEELKSNQ